MEKIILVGFDEFQQLIKVQLNNFLKVAHQGVDALNGISIGIVRATDELQLIREALQQKQGSVPTGLRVTETAINLKGETNMVDHAKKFSGVDMQILPNGKVRYTISLVPSTAVLAPGTSPIAGVSSAPASLAVAPDPDPVANPSGLVFLGTPVLPPVPATGIVATFSVTLLPAQGGATLSIDADPVDVVLDPTQPTGLAVVESAG